MLLHLLQPAPRLGMLFSFVRLIESLPSERRWLTRSLSSMPQESALVVVVVVINGRTHMLKVETSLVEIRKLRRRARTQITQPTRMALLVIKPIRPNKVFVQVLHLQHPLRHILKLGNLLWLRRLNNNNYSESYKIPTRSPLIQQQKHTSELGLVLIGSTQRRTLSRLRLPQLALVLLLHHQQNQQLALRLIH